MMLPIVISMPVLALIFLIVAVTTGYVTFTTIEKKIDPHPIIFILSGILFWLSAAGFVIVMATLIPWGSLIRVVP